jgi:PAS domain S-box-containing protein
MDTRQLTYEDLIRENQSLKNEIDRLRQDQIDISHLSNIIFDRKRTEQSFKRINDALLGLGPSFEENVNLLTRLCGELTGATCSLYNRLEGNNLCSIGLWNAPPGFCAVDQADGHICTDVILQGTNQVVFLNDLPKTSYFLTDPNVSAYNLVSYIGKSVSCDGRVVGSLCAVYQTEITRSLEHEQIFTIIASAIGNEESRNHAQKKLRDSEERFHSAFLTSPDSININRLSDGMYVDINEGFSKLSGYTREDCIGKTSLELNIWDDPRDRDRLVDGLRKNGSVENLETVFRLKDGSKRVALMSARVFSLQGVPHILSVTRDMTEWKKAILALQESELKFRSVVENAFDGIYLITNQRFIYSNQRFCEIMGYSADEILSDTFDFLVTLTDKSRDLVERRRQARIRGEQIPGIYEFEIRTKDGQIKEVEVSTVKLDSHDEVQILGIMRDITERRRLFEELVKARDKAEEVNILKSRLLANLSHEIRTPLNGILGFAELLRDELKDESLSSMADVIYSSGNRLLHTLNAILDLSVIEARFNKMSLHQVSLNKLAEEVSILFMPNTLKKGIHMSFTADDSDIVVFADEELATKILNNLINNAIKFTHDGGISVRTSLERSGSYTFGCIHVTDTGIGIRKENLQVIFEEFRQVSEGQNRSYDGSGLGLHISKRFAEMMGGTITVKSKVGHGSTFTLLLPIQ